ncbi:MAG: tRNA (guanosine(46)-N7)-methyltransferase TrmB [Planctomycetota bacterium]|jgi:tRNA (guanine-N7-)-methyltransferase
MQHRPPQVSDRNPQFSPRSRFCDPVDESRFATAIATDLPIELEIGSGKGLFLTQAALQQPQRRFIGLELATKYAREAQSKLERLGIMNASFIACDAVAVIDRDVPDTSLAAVHVYFPDPWWKSKHKKRRVLSDETMTNIERTLLPGGQLHFWTDVLDYYEEAVARIMDLTRFRGPFYVPEPTATHAMDYRTHFERRTRLNGLPVYRARFEKP